MKTDNGLLWNNRCGIFADTDESEEFPELTSSAEPQKKVSFGVSRPPKSKKGWTLLDTMTDDEAMRYCRDLDHAGELRIAGVEDASNGLHMNLGFQVTDVKKPLISVRRIAERGNHINFGLGPDDNYIQNRKSGFKIPLRRTEKGSYILDVKFVGGGTAEIVVDSGAEESVCPKEWGSQFGIQEPDRVMRFRNASGGSINHYGHRNVMVVAPF